MPYCARRNAMNCTLGKQNSPSINEWPNTDVPLPLDKIHLYTNTWKKADTPLKTARCVYWREKTAELEGVSSKPSTFWLKKINKQNIFKLGWHFLSPTYNAVLHSRCQHSKHSHRLVRPDDSPKDIGEGNHSLISMLMVPWALLSSLLQASLELVKPSGERKKCL